ncbi:MAG TPA: hypothetical protein VGX23_33735 [Actinocrinis sp.]|nr:hypothetical protein [Actinocrinis sp.]
MTAKLTARGMLAAVGVVSAVGNDVRIDLLDVLGDVPVAEALHALGFLGARGLLLGYDPEQFLADLALAIAQIEGGAARD